MNIWTANSNESAFKHRRQPKNYSTSLIFDAAKGAYESGQIVMRDLGDFEITDVTYDDMKGSNSIIKKENFRINHQEYLVYNDGIPYPDPLSNKKEAKVLAHTAHTIWITLYVPEDTKAGNYSGEITVHTNLGEFKVPIITHVYNVTIPDTVHSKLSMEYFIDVVAFWGMNGKAAAMPGYYDYDRYTKEWWTLMEQFAKAMKEARINAFSVYTLNLLADGGTHKVGDTWEYKWDRFDEVVEFFIKNAGLKILSGFHFVKPVDGLEVYTVDYLEDGSLGIVNRPFSSAEAEAWVDSFLPNLYEHLKEKGWLEMWVQRLQDEPHTSHAWKWTREKMHKHMPGVKCGEPLDTHEISKELTGYMNQYIPRIEIFEKEQIFYKERQMAGDEIWVYSCCFPEEQWYLNKFCDLPHCYSRLMSWACYSHGISGFLHWGFNYWSTVSLYGTGAGTRYKCDGSLIHPETEANRIKYSTRFIATRDGAQDFELLSIVASKFKEEAMSISRTLAEGFDKFNADPEVITQARRRLLSLAEIV